MAGGAHKVRRWGNGYALLREDDEDGDVIDVDRTDDLNEPHFARLIAVCTTREAASAAYMLVTGFASWTRRMSAEQNRPYAPPKLTRLDPSDPRAEALRRELGK